MTDLELVKLAIKARELSYSPYSHFAVGAAVLCKDGSTYLGANVENAVYSLTVCAERNAIFHAMMEGKKKEDFVALAVVCDTKRPGSPCGSCRQVISELMPKDTRIVLGNLKCDMKVTSIDELLPYAFTKEDL
ncbi:MAG: cytidine deaminase [Bacilli bacterium]|nr:cytidine deaminase [Bacilli bacterium]